MKLLSAVVHFSLRNRPIVLVGTLLLVFAGLNAARQLPIDAVPDVTNVQVQIITASPALSPVEVEQYITVPVERAMAGIPRTSELRSISKYGMSVVTIVFTEGTDIYFARQMVNERMREAESEVPRSYGTPEMGPISTGLGEIYQFEVVGENRSLMQLEEELDWYITPQLRMVPGIIEVNSFGGENREYQVVVDPKRLQASGLSVREVVEAIEKTNANAGGGYIERNREQLVIGTQGLVQGPDDLKTVVVGATAQGVPITLANVADVRFGPRLRRGAASANGKGEVVIGVAMMLMGENSRTVTEAVKSKLAELGPSLPAGMRIVPFYDRSALVNRTIHTVLKNLGEGAALVIIVLLLLLGDIRAGLVVASVIPLAMLFALVLMNAVGLSGNLMSLGAIDFGLIVDGSVIIVENTVRHMRELRMAKGSPLSPDERLEAVGQSSLEVRSASIFGEMIIAIVYLPILALRGIEGKLFHPMATTVLFAVAGALILSLTVVPVLASYLLVPSDREHETWLMRQVLRLFAPASRWTLRHRGKVLLAGFLVLALGVGVFTRLGAEFIPQLDEGDLVVEARRLPGISLTESVATALRLESALLTLPEVIDVVTRTGAPEVATDPMGVEQSDVYVRLKPRDQWRDEMSREALIEEMSAILDREVPEVAHAISQPIQMRTNELIAGVRSDVAAQLYGPDLDKLQELAERLAGAIRKVPGAVDVRAAQTAGLGYIRIRPDRGRLARYGLTVEELNMLTETIAVGRQAGMVFEKDRRFPIAVKTSQTGDELEAIRALPLKANTGQMVPLGDVATVAVEQGPVLVNREKQSRRASVEFNIRGRDLVSTVATAQAAIAREVRLPSGYRIEWEGEFKNYESARQRLLIVVPVALGLIIFMLWLAFREIKPALLIFLNVPFAIVGGAIALWLRDLPFSISAGVGFIALFGVAVLNGLVLVSFARKMEANGMSPLGAIGHAAEMRVRPVLMTAMVAALGFIPMALSRAPGSEVQRPLASVVIGGLVTATLLTLFLFPAVFVAASRKRRSASEPPSAKEGAIS